MEKSEGKEMWAQIAIAIEIGEVFHNRAIWIYAMRWYNAIGDQSGKGIDILERDTKTLM